MKKFLFIVLMLCGLSYINAQKSFRPNSVEINGQTIQPDTLWYNIIEYNGDSCIEIVRPVSGFYEGYIYIPDTIDRKPVKSIGNRAFVLIVNDSAKDNTLINNIILPQTIEQIGYRSFWRCHGMKEFDLPNLKSIGEGAFINTDIKNIVLPENITIAKYSFQACYYLTSVILPQSLTSLPQYCFYDCYKLKDISISKNLNTIEAKCFTDCASIEEIYLPHTVSLIGDSAFIGCTFLSKFIFPNNENVSFSNILGGEARLRWAGEWKNAIIGETECTAENNKLREIYIYSTNKPRLTGGHPFQNIEAIHDTLTLYVPNNKIDLYMTDTMYNRYSNLEIKGIIGEEFDSSNSDSIFTLSWNPVSNTTEYHILIVDTANIDTIGDFLFDDDGNNVTESYNQQSISRRMPMEGTKDVFTLKLKVGNGTDGNGTPSTEQKAGMPAGQRTLLVEGMSYQYTIVGTDKDNQETFRVESSFTVQNSSDSNELVTPIETNAQQRNYKIIKDGQIIIVTPENKYDLKGTRLK